MKGNGINTNKKELYPLPIHSAKTDVGIAGDEVFQVMNPSDEEPGNQQTGELHEGNDDMLTESKLLTVKEVAAILRISRFSVYNLVKRGDLPAVKVLNKLRFSHQNIEEYLSKHKINK